MEQMMNDKPIIRNDNTELQLLNDINMQRQLRLDYNDVKTTLTHPEKQSVNKHQLKQHNVHYVDEAYDGDTRNNCEYKDQQTHAHIG